MPERARPLLSAALIVRDEERHLPACLASLAAVVDETVVVDTGSTDASIAIARAHGARVVHHRWEGDFSAARNVALDQARGMWILYIDADERLRPVRRERLVRLLADAPEVCFRILLHPFVRSTPYYEYRLWRSDPRIRFRGVIHEQVVAAIEDVGAADGRPVSTCDLLALDHVGYEADQVAKHHRNLPLLLAQLDREPSNIFNWRHLARVWAGTGQPERAEDALERAVQLDRASPAPTGHGGLAWADLVRLRHGRGDDVTKLLAEGRARWPDNWLLVWIEGQVHLDAGSYEAAAASFRRLLAVDTATLPAAGVAYDDRVFGCFAQASLGLSLFRLGRYDEAAQAFASAERLEPGNDEYRVKRLLAESRLKAAAAPSGPGSPPVPDG